MTTQSRNEPCACGSGKKFKRCCGSETLEAGTIMSTPAHIAQSLPSPEERRTELKRLLDTQLLKYAPEVTSLDVEGKIKEALKSQGDKASPIETLKTVFTDDNLTIRNRKHADRLFRSFLALWQDIAQEAPILPPKETKAAGAKG